MFDELASVVLNAATVVGAESALEERAPWFTIHLLERRIEVSEEAKAIAKEGKEAIKLAGQFIIESFSKPITAAGKFITEMSKKIHALYANAQKTIKAFWNKPPKKKLAAIKGAITKLFSYISDNAETLTIYVSNHMAEMRNIVTGRVNHRPNPDGGRTR